MRLLRARWADGLDIGNIEVLESVAASIGMSPGTVSETIADTRSRARLTATTKEALSIGVFGSPTVAVGGELFWGADRMWLLDRYLAAGEKYSTGCSDMTLLAQTTESPPV